jgi:prevent-host-death family protein
VGRAISRRRAEWQLQEAKAQFSEVVRRAHAVGPQWVTKQGKPAAVVLSVDDYDRLRSPRHRQSLSAFLHASPLTGVGLTLERSSEPMRAVKL